MPRVNFDLGDDVKTDAEPAGSDPECPRECNRPRSRSRVIGRLANARRSSTGRRARKDIAADTASSDLSSFVDRECRLPPAPVTPPCGKSSITAGYSHGERMFRYPTDPVECREALRVLGILASSELQGWTGRGWVRKLTGRWTVRSCWSDSRATRGQGGMSSNIEGSPTPKCISRRHQLEFNRQQVQFKSKKAVLSLAAASYWLKKDSGLSHKKKLT